MILTLSCPDRHGIVAAVSAFLLQRDANISDAQQFGDASTATFFMRVVFEPADGDAEADIHDAFSPLAERFSMDWTMRGRTPRKVMILTSRFDHCLADLLYRWRIDELPMQVTAVVSNHPRQMIGHVDLGDLPFHHLPVSAADKPAQEAELLRLIEATDTELVVLARYMQILSAEFTAAWHMKIINIHHSFLPAFVGADPYRPAYEKGVKLIGATAHYVTADLDQGPIIEQDVHRVSHRHHVAELRAIGQDVERSVLTRAVRWHLQNRVIVTGNKTVVFN